MPFCNVFATILPMSRNGIISMHPKACYQHKTNAIRMERNMSVNASTRGGTESVATPLMTVVSFCMMLDKTAVEFSWKSK
jgi:hypothetical protein